METTDCSCKNYDVQFKLIQIATEENYRYTALSANRKDLYLFDKAKTKYATFVQRFFAEDIIFRINIGSRSAEYDSLEELLITGNAQNPSNVEATRTAEVTIMATTPNFVITECEIDYTGTETVRLDGLYTFYARTDCPALTDVIERYIGTYEFVKGADNTYFVSKLILKADRFSIQNAKTRTGTDAVFNTFDH